MEQEMQKRPQAPARKRRKEQLRTSKQPPVCTEVDSSEEKTIKTTSDSAPTCNSTLGLLETDLDHVDKEKCSLSSLYPSLEEVVENIEDQDSEILLENQEALNQDQEVEADTLNILSSLVDQVCLDLINTKLSSEHTSDTGEWLHIPEEFNQEVLEEAPEEASTAGTSPSSETENDEDVSVAPNDLNSVERRTSVSSVVSPPLNVTQVPEGWASPPVGVAEMDGNVSNLSIDVVGEEASSNGVTQERTNHLEAKPSIGFDVEHTLDMLEEISHNLTTVSSELSVIIESAAAALDLEENTFSRFSCDFSGNMDIGVKKISPEQLSKRIFHQSEERSAVAESIECNRHGHHHHVEVCTTYKCLQDEIAGQQEVPNGEHRPMDGMDHIPPFRTSFKQLSALKPTGLQSKGLSQGSVKTSTTSSSTIQLKVTWDDLADIYGLNTDIDEDTEVMIQYYQMLMNESLLPARTKSPQPLEDRQPSQVTIMKLKTTVNQSDSPSMQNYYAAGSSASATDRGKSSSRRSTQGARSSSRRLKSTMPTAKPKSPPRSCPVHQLQAAATSPRQSAATLQRNDSWTRKLSMRTRSVISRVRSRVQSIFNRRADSANTRTSRATISATRSPIHVDVPIAPLPLPIAVHPSLL